MTLIRRDQGLPRTLSEAELCELLRRAEHRAESYARLAAAQDRVVQAARAFHDGLSAELRCIEREALAVALRELDREHGRVLLDSVPPALRAAPTGPSAFEMAAWEAEAGPHHVAIVAILTCPSGEERWHFDFAADVGSAYEKLRRWNERAAREWPDLRFSLALTRLP